MDCGRDDSGVKRNPSYHEPIFDPLWSALQELDLPIGVHSGADDEPLSIVSDIPLHAMVCDNKMFMMQRSLALLITSAVPQRYPKLKFVIVEADWLDCRTTALHGPLVGRSSPLDGTEAGGAAEFLLQTSILGDFRGRPRGHPHAPFARGRSLMWARTTRTRRDLPVFHRAHQEGFVDVPENETRMMVRDNATRLYGIG